MNASTENLDPRIGILQRAEGIAFYAYPNGYAAEAVVGSREVVEAALGITADSAARVARKPRREQPIREFLVTVSTVENPVGGNPAFYGSYTESILARTRSEAISVARAMRVEREGRIFCRAVPAKFRAVLAV